MTRSEAEIRKLIADAWDLYRRMPRVTKTVDLHAAGFAFGGPVVQLRGRSGPVTELPIVADPDVLRSIGVGLFIAGAATVTIHPGADRVTLTEGDGCTFEHRALGSYDEGVPPGELWHTAVNHDAMMMLLEPAVAQRTGEEGMQALFGPMLAAMLPMPLMRQQEAANLPYQVVDNALLKVISTIERMQFSFARQLEVCLRGQFDAPVVEWRDGLREQDGAGAFRSMVTLGRIYRLFLAQGIELRRVREEITGMARDWSASRLISQREAEAVRASFDG